MHSGGGVSSADILRIKGFFRCERPNFFVQEREIFRNLSCIRTNKGGVEPVRTFSDKEGVKFWLFCADDVF